MRYFFVDVKNSVNVFYVRSRFEIDDSFESSMFFLNDGKCERIFLIHASMTLILKTFFGQNLADD